MLFDFDYPKDMRADTVRVFQNIVVPEAQRCPAEGGKLIAPLCVGDKRFSSPMSRSIDFDNDLMLRAGKIHDEARYRHLPSEA